MRATPVVDDWNGDGRKDLLIGNFDGNILIYINDGTDEKPSFNSPPSYLKVKNKIYKVSEGGRAAPRIFDWNRDGVKDLLVGEFEGYIYFLKNIGSNKDPRFKNSSKLMLTTGLPLQYPDEGSSPRSRLFVSDWNNDGAHDIVVGGKDGRVMLYASIP